MQIKALALAFLVLSSTLASGECVLQTQEDELVPEQFNFTAFTWAGNNTTSLQRLPDEESEAILMSLMDSSWLENDTTYLQKVPDEKAGAILGDMEPSVQKDGAVYILFRSLLPPIVILVDYMLEKLLKKKAKEDVGGSGFTCECGVDYTNVMHTKNCCEDVKKRWNGKIWVQYFGNCEKGCDEICRLTMGL